MMSSTGDSFGQSIYQFILHNSLIYFFILFPYFDTHIIEAYTDIAWGGGFNDDL